MVPLPALDAFGRLTLAGAPRTRVLVAIGVLTPVYAVLIAVQATVAVAEWIPLMLSWVVFLPLAAWIIAGAREPVPPSAARQPHRTSLRLVALAAIVVGLPGLFAGPQMSSDAYRYVWDGRVQLAGIDPYRYVPLDDHLARLRDPTLFPGTSRTDSTGATSPTGSLDDLRRPRDTRDFPASTVINRPLVPTIYPPLAEGWFAVVAALTPARFGTLGLQLSFLLVAAATSVLIGWSLRRNGHDPATAILYAACPVVFVEAANNAHIDVLAAGLVTAAVIFAHRRWLAGVLLGLAVAVKLTPLLLLPVFLGRRVRDSLATVAATALTVAVAYLPHVLVVGWLALGYLPGYLSEEGYESGLDRFKTLELLLPGVPAPALGAIVLVMAAAVAVVALVRARREPVAPVAVWLFGWVVLITTPTYPWYVIPVLALAVLARRYEWAALAIACYGSYAFYDHARIPGVLFGLAAAVVLVVQIRRTLVNRRRPAVRPG